MSTPPQPSFMACAVSRTESGSAHQPIEQLDLLFRGERVRFRVGAEDGEPHVLAEEPAALPYEALGVGGEIGLEGRDDGRENAGDAIAGAHNRGSLVERLLAPAHRTSASGGRP